MQRAGIATIFELSDMISPNVRTISADGRVCWAVPVPYSDGLLARIRAAWEIICWRAYPVRWPKAGDLELAMSLHHGGGPAFDFVPPEDKKDIYDKRSQVAADMMEQRRESRT